MSDKNNHSFMELAAAGISGLHPYIPGKPMDELERELGITDTLKLASNENPLGPCPKGMAAALEEMSGVNYYPDDSGYRLRNKLADKLNIDPMGITLGTGSSDVIDMVARTFLCPGRNAVFSAHSFAMYPIYTQACAAEAKVAAPYPADHASMPYGHDLSAMAALVDENTRVVFIANPNNPTGTWLNKTELEGFLADLPKTAIVVLDEAYFEYVEDPDFPNGMDWLEQFPNLIVTRTFSKIYGLAGLRVGYGVSNPELAGVINRVRHPFNINNAALAAAEAALDDDEFLNQSRSVNLQGLKQLSSALESRGLACIPSVGNFITVDVGRSGPEVYDELLKLGVIVRPIANYKLPNHLRVTVGRKEENDRFLDALAKVLA